jgi:hypothetical protein
LTLKSPGNWNGGEESSSGVSWLDAALALALLVIAITYFSLTFTRTFELRDEGYILHRSARVAGGEVPHRDFSAVYGPGVYAINALVLRLFGLEILPIRFLVALIKGGAVALTFLVTRLLVPRPFAALGSLLAVVYWGRMSWNLNTPYASLYTIPICMLSLYALIRANLRPSACTYFVAGVLGGAAVLFKQSLGVFNAYGMVLTVWALSMLHQPTAPRSFSKALIALFLWVISGLIILLPFRSVMSLQDYFLHFFPLHVLMALLGAALIRPGGASTLVPNLKVRLIPLIFGLFAVPGLTALLYGHWGALDKVFYNMIVFPQTLMNYYLPSLLPPYVLALFALGSISLLTAGMLLIAGRQRAALLLATAAFLILCLTVYFGPFQITYFLGTPFLWRGSGAFSAVLSPAISLVILAIFASSFLQSYAGRRTRTLHILTPILCFQAMMSFQTFPRAGYDVFILHGALMPLLTIILFKWYRLGAPSGTGIARRTAAATLVLIFSLWLVGKIADDVLRPSEVRSQRRVLSLPGTQGIRPSYALIDMLRIQDLERLIAYLESVEPKQSPIFSLTNQEMIGFLSRRQTLFPERECYLFLAGWGMLPARQLEDLDSAAMIRKLRETPTAIVIDRQDHFSARIRAALPEVSDFVRDNYGVEARVGTYRILIQKSGSMLLE